MPHHLQMILTIRASLPLGAGTNDVIAAATDRNQKLIAAMTELGYRNVELVPAFKRVRGDGAPDALPDLPDHLRAPLDH